MPTIESNNHFKFSKYMNVLESTIRTHLTNQSFDKSLVVGLHAEWGSGKTYLLNGIKNTVIQENPLTTNEEKSFIIPVIFNAWRFEKEEHLIIPLLKSLNYTLDKFIEKDKTLYESIASIKTTLMSLISGIEWNIGVVKISYKDMLAYEEKALKQEENKLDNLESLYFDIIQRIQELTANTNIKFLFLIDDIDRCLPENSLRMLEAMKLFLDVANCAFVMAIDKEVLELAIKHRYKEYIKDDEPMPITASEYMEKIITLPFTFPLYQKLEVKKFIKAEYQKINLFEINNTLLDIILDTIPANPRKIIRTIELLHLKTLLHENENETILLIVTLMELFLPELDRAIKKDIIVSSFNRSNILTTLIETKNTLLEDNIDLNNTFLTEWIKEFKVTRNTFNLNIFFSLEGLEPKLLKIYKAEYHA